MQPLIILGRDGVLLEPVAGGLLSVSELCIIPGSLEAVSRLNHAGYRVALTTNQPTLGEGRLNIETLNAIHARLAEGLARVGGHLDALLTCPHSEGSGCECRKPGTGMLREIADRLDTPLETVTVIGDDAADIDAACAVNARPLLVLTGRGQATRADYPEVPAFDDLDRAVSWILAQR